MAQPQQSEIREAYRSLLARGLEPAEAANLTAFLHGLPSENLHWSVREVEALVVQRRRFTTEITSPASAPAATHRT